LPLSCLLWSGWPLELGDSCTKAARIVPCYWEMLQLRASAPMVVTLDRGTLQVPVNKNLRFSSELVWQVCYFQLNVLTQSHSKGHTAIMSINRQATRLQNHSCQTQETPVQSVILWVIQDRMSSSDPVLYFLSINASQTMQSRDTLNIQQFYLKLQSRQ
jgi:hypothetical protein